MRKGMLVFGVVLTVALVLCSNAYADAAQPNAWEGFWNSVGGFVYNTLPWNWGNWAGK